MVENTQNSGTEMEKVNPAMGDATSSQSSAGDDSAQKSAQGAATEETVQVSTSDLKALFAKIDAIQAENLQNQKQIEVLRESVSRGRLEEAEGKRAVKGPPKAKIMIHEGKLVVGWKMEKNQLIYSPINQQVPVSEDMKIRLKYSDGKESEVLQYVEFVRNLDRVLVEQVSVKKDESDRVYAWIVKSLDPEVPFDDLVIDPQFLNP